MGKPLTSQSIEPRSDITRDGPHLQLPHPRFAERAFVIVPLHELAPNLTIEGQSVQTLFDTFDRSGVERNA
ncbi:MAG: hypothetical protein FGM26_14310 [Beijerinckiaceae bacterium]|nr:hypothetical protein [Beijerinckiaceae bacterium]